MSLGSILNTARNAIQTYQTAIQVTSNNIANASTEGYSRQRAVITPTDPLQMPFGSVGTGVQVETIVRHRDHLLDAQFRREQGAAGYHAMREGLLSGIEATLAEPSAAGLAASLDSFFSAYADLANDPTSTSARAALRESARRLAGKFNSMDADVQRLGTSLTRDLDGVVAQVNDLAVRIADLNKRIVTAEADGTQAPTLRDERDRLVDELSRHADVQVIERPTGEFGVFAGGVPIVDGPVARTLEVRLTGGTAAIGLVGKPTVLSGLGGELGARIDVINSDVPAVRGRLDALADAFVTRVNQIHQTGTNPLGLTAVDLFDPAGLTAGTIGLSVDVLASSDAISAGTGDPLGAYQAGANDVALQLAALRDEQNATLGLSFGGYHARTATDIGLAVASAGDRASAHDALASRAETHRQSVSGVLTDEEVISLIEFQQAYTAATRLVSVADEMIQSVLAMV